MAAGVQDVRHQIFNCTGCTFYLTSYDGQPDRSTNKAAITAAQQQDGARANPTTAGALNSTGYAVAPPGNNYDQNQANENSQDFDFDAWMQQQWPEIYNQQATSSEPLPHTQPPQAGAQDLPVVHEGYVPLAATSSSNADAPSSENRSFAADGPPNVPGHAKPGDTTIKQGDGISSGGYTVAGAAKDGDFDWNTSMRGPYDGSLLP